MGQSKGEKVKVVFLYYNSVCSQEDFNIVSFFVAFITMETQVKLSLYSRFSLFCFFVLFSLLWREGGS